MPKKRSKSSQSAARSRASTMAAVAKGLTVYRQRESVVAVGLGFKRRRRGGYGARPTPCVTFTVLRKSKRPPAGERVPPWIEVASGGRTHRLPTDVRSRARAFAHALPMCRIVSPDEPTFGTPGFLLRSGADGRAWLVSAGHALLRGVSPPDDRDRVGVGSAVPYAECGAVIAPVTHARTPPPDAALIDVGVVRLTAPMAAAVRAALDRPPWSLMRRVVPLREIIDAHRAAAKPYYAMHGATSGEVRCRFAVANFSPYQTEVEENRRRRQDAYAAVTLLSEGTTDSERFRPGDSGGPLVDGSGAVYGVHILGIGGTAAGSPAGLAVSAASIVDLLRARLRDPSIDLVGPAEV